jgi:aminoglycoside 2'-N-acetyltransferase I
MSPPLLLAVVAAPNLVGRQKKQVVRLCTNAFEVDYAPFLKSFGDCTHLLGFIGPELISHALWLRRRLRVGDTWVSNAAYIEAMATKEGYEGRGYGSAVMRRVHEEIRSYEIAALSTSVPEWYERLGWERWRGPRLILRGAEVIPTPDDAVMVHAPSGVLPDVNQTLAAEWRPLELW